MAVDMAVDSQQQPGPAPSLMAAPAPEQVGSRPAAARMFRAEAVAYVAKYDQMRKLCAQRLREKYFLEQAPGRPSFYDSEVQVGEFSVKESSEDPAVSFMMGMAGSEELQGASSWNRSLPDADAPRLPMSRLKSQARKK